jgi:hypothetical protein
MRLTNPSLIIKLNILTIKGLTGFKTGDFLAVVVIAGSLARIDNGITFYIAVT